MAGLVRGSRARFRVASRASKNFPRKERTADDSMAKDPLEKLGKRKHLLGHVRKNLHLEAQSSGTKRKRMRGAVGRAVAGPFDAVKSWSPFFSIVADGHHSKEESRHKKHKSDGHSEGKSEKKLLLSSAERAERKKVKQQEYKKRVRLGSLALFGRFRSDLCLYSGGKNWSSKGETFFRLGPGLFREGRFGNFGFKGTGEDG